MEGGREAKKGRDAKRGSSTPCRSHTRHSRLEGTRVFCSVDGEARGREEGRKEGKEEGGRVAVREGRKDL